MKVGLIDVDGHNFPNLALMRISAYHKSQGDSVEWWWGFDHYDIVYMSKIFSNEYTKDIPEPLNADRIIKGGTGYCISLGPDGKERFDESKNTKLPPEIERMFPDYSIYPQFDFAVSMTSRGCPRGCAFCHVAAKEGRCSKKEADVSDFWNGQKEIKVLDPNITACKEKRDLFHQVRDNMADFNQIKERFDGLRKLTMDAIGRELEIDCCGKIYEGIFEWTVSYPDCYDDPEAKAGPEFYVLKLHCYLLGSSRHYEWRGRTPEIVLNKAEKEIKSWLT